VLKKIYLEGIQELVVMSLPLHLPLKFISLGGTQNYDLRFLSSYPLLEYLILSSAQDYTIKSLPSCLPLKKLVLKTTQISNLEFLLAYPMLEELRFHDSQVSNLEILLSCQALKELSLSSNLGIPSCSILVCLSFHLVTYKYYYTSLLYINFLKIDFDGI
jgi:hypothetical protein